MGRGDTVSADALAQNAIDLLEAILDEQLEHDPEPSHQLANGLFDLAVDAYENRVITVGRSLLIMTKCYETLRPGKTMDWEKAEELLGNK